jgi:hypothetical protein
MSENTIEPQPDNDQTAATGAPEAGDTSGQPQPQDDSNLSAEAKGWRLKYRDEQQKNAELITQTTDVAAKLRAAEHKLVDQHIGNRVHSADDFWQRHDHSELLDESGEVDLAKVDGLVDAMPAHMLTPPPGMPMVAPADTVSGDVGMIGGRPSSVLDPHQVAQETPSWADVFQGTVNEMRPPAST